MKNLLTIMLAVWLAGNVFAADAANDLILSQRKPDNSGSIQRNVPATAAITSGSLPSFLTALGLGTGDSPAFTGLTLSGLTSGRVPFATTAGLLTDSASLTFNSGTGALTATSFNGNVVGGTISGTTGTFSGNLSTGVGGTGTGTSLLIANGGSGSGGGGILRIQRNSVTTANIGNESAVIGGTSDDLALNSGGSVGIYVGGAEKGRFTSTGLNSTVIGATTAAAGSFTTLSSSQSVASSYAVTNLTNSNATGYVRLSLNANAASVAKNFEINWAPSIVFRLASPDTTPIVSTVNGTDITTVSSAGLAVTGATSTTGSLYAGTADSDSGGRIGAKFSGASLSGISLIETADQSGATFTAFKKSDGTTIGSIARVTTTDAIVVNTTSDRDRKTNITDFTAKDSGRLIDALRPRWFDWKLNPEDEFVTGKEVDTTDEKGAVVAGKPIKTKRANLDASRKAQLEADAAQFIGFIAQEEDAADPVFARIGAVTRDAEGVARSRSDTALIPILVAELQALRARVKALEAKK